MLVARARKSHRARASPRDAVVVGAGIAGATCAFALARRGISVQLLEANALAGQGASGNPAALVRPFPGLDVGPRSRFTWSAFAYACRHYRMLAGEGTAWQQTGVLQLARDAAHAEKQARAMERVPIPDSLCRAVSAEEGTELCGGKVTASGLWLGEGGWVVGAGIVTAALQAVESLVVKTAKAVNAIEPREDGFLIRTAGGHVVESPCVILANGHAASGLLPGNTLALRTVRGQASLLAEHAAGLRAPVCQEGYVTPAVGGTHVVGATYDEESDGLGAREQDDRMNVARAKRMLPEVFKVAEVAGSWVGLRCVSADRRPVMGELQPGLYGCLAFGSRGFTWAPLAGELIASMITGEPLPLERSVARAISPVRFAKKKR
jgi:tRNA 5-methylaminomethyl-2-thiouridine biosynthesis bifunctional protein